MMYKTELHLHSRDASLCADVSAREIADKYIEAGYNTVVVTNHFNNMSKEAYGCSSWEEYVRLFVHAWEKIQHYACSRLHVLFGAEIRFDDCDNDYLLYGLTPEYLYSHPDLLTDGPFRSLPRMREDGIMVFQAHPFRTNMKIMPPELFDGYEVSNGHVGHNSHNETAYHWAVSLHKKMISGTDHHHSSQRPNGGILTEHEICSIQDLLSELKNEQYLLINSMLEHEPGRPLSLEKLIAFSEGYRSPKFLHGERFTDDEWDNEWK